MANWLQAAGHEAEHVERVGLRSAKDGAVVVTKDEDFASRAAGQSTAPVIVWLRIGNATNPVLRAWFEPRLSGIVQMIAEGHRVIEVV